MSIFIFYFTKICNEILQKGEFISFDSMDTGSLLIDNFFCYENKIITKWFGQFEFVICSNSMNFLFEMNLVECYFLSQTQGWTFRHCSFSITARYPDWVNEIMGEALWREICLIVNKPKHNVKLKSVTGQVHCKRKKCCACEPFTLGVADN